MSQPTPRDDDSLLQDETTITDITIQPDGRLYVFGASRDVTTMLGELCPNDPRLQRMLDHLRALDAAQPAAAQPVAAAAAAGGPSRATE